MSLNPEPSAPEERDAQQLPPKSYADAAEEALEPESHASDQVDSTAESHLPNVEETANGVRPNGIDILRIVPADDGNDNDAHSVDKEDREASSYEGAGTDETPKSPVARGAHKKGSRSSLGSIGRTQGVRINGRSSSMSSSNGSVSGLFNGNGATKIEGDVLTTIKPALELEKSNQPEQQLKRRNSELKAGRQAGAGWATSK